MRFNREWFDRPDFMRKWLENYWKKNFPDTPLVAILCMMDVWQEGGTAEKAEEVEAAQTDETEAQAFADGEGPGEITWDETGEDGTVDEVLLIENTDTETLTYVAQQLQDLCSEIGEKGEKDKTYWLTGQWYSDATGSEQYANVVSLGEKAEKPLFLIIWKSENAGMYEWVCSRALDEISGLDFSEENNGAGWRDSKEFLEMFIRRIAEQRN